MRCAANHVGQPLDHCALLWRERVVGEFRARRAAAFPPTLTR